MVIKMYLKSISISDAFVDMSIVIISSLLAFATIDRVFVTTQWVELKINDVLL